jgi:serine/threonine-protein kinase
MPLEIGSRLGHYDVTALIGEGGMGQVYQATDTKLNRQVALKILPEAFASDPDRLARFQREAQVLASLNHPNIAAIHGLEDSEGTKALVLELVEGPTLADRIAQGPIPLEEALPIAKQIAEALEAAHEAGVIHRDLKPANVVIRDDGTVKVLDFGLAKAFQPDASDVSQSMSPTISLTAAATQMGMVIGTAAYMAPEQAKGKVVDKRADVWAFGAVLFEMLTAQKPFTGDDVSTTLARVIEREPDWEALPSNLSPVLATYLRRCLAKEPKQRVHDVADVRLAMEGAFETTTVSTSEAVAPQPAVWWQALPWVAGIVMGGVVVGLSVWSLMRSSVTELDTVTRFVEGLPPDAVISDQHGMALSPDGRTLVYAAAVDGVPQLFVRTRDQVTPRPVPGTEDARYPFFSPDGASVGFFTSDSLKRVFLDGGPSITLCPVGQRYGATWGRDGTIVFASSVAPGLMQVPAEGGEPRPLTEPTPEESTHRWPTFVPGGEAVIFTVGPVPVANQQIVVMSLSTGEQRPLVQGASATVSASGHLVFAREASLWAVPFDADRQDITGEPTPMVEDVQVNAGGWAHYALADDGTLVYLRGGTAADQKSLVWVDGSGQETELEAPAAPYVYPRISPDGTRVAVGREDQQFDVWIWDLSGETLTPLTSGPGVERYGEWTPESQQVVFDSDREGVAALFRRSADFTGSADRLIGTEEPQFPQAIAPDGSAGVFRTSPGATVSSDLKMLSLTGDPVSEDLLSTEFDELNAAISPDGRWFAYQSDRSGEFEVYVRSFPDADAAPQRQISTSGGTRPVWGPEGTELFYVNSNRLWAVEIDMEPTYSRGTPTMIIDDNYVLDVAGPGRMYDVDPIVGERFLMIKPLGVAGSSISSLDVVLNFDEELKERVPVP